MVSFIWKWLTVVTLGGEVHDGNFLGTGFQSGIFFLCFFNLGNDYTVCKDSLNCTITT